MRRLDELLTAASDRGHRTGPDVLIEHLERRLAGEREQVVAVPSRRSTMVATETRPTTPIEHPPRRRSRWAYALAAFVLVASSVAVAIAMLGDGGEEEVTVVTQERAIELVQDFAANVRNGDLEALIAGSPTGILANGFLEWHHGLQADPEFSNCQIRREGPNGFTVGCDVTYDPASFFARAASPTTRVAIDVFPDGLVNVSGWPPPAGLGDVALELREFFDARHPDLVDTAFGTSGYAGLAWTQEAGETIDAHLDEFIEWRTAPPQPEALTRDAIMDRLVAAVTEIDPAKYAELTYQSFELDIAGRDFLDWNLALDTDPVFSDCEETTTGVRCRAAMGESWFFSSLAGENLVLTVTARIEEGNVLNVETWPPSMDVTAGERAFRTWIRETHPELEDRMFGEVLGMFKFTTEAGELHMQYLEEYLASR